MPPSLTLPVAPTLAALAVLVASAFVVARRRARVLDEVTRGIRALHEDRPVRPVQTRPLGAAGRLAGTFNTHAVQLEGRIAGLEEDRQLLRAVLGGMAEGVIAVDARRRLLFANAAADRLFGLDPNSVGRLVPELIRAPQVDRAVEATLSGPEAHRVEIAVPAPDGRLRGNALVLAVQGTPLPGSPPPGAVLVFHDVTETRRLERVRQDFVANASHELKTPVAAIKAYAETLLDGALHDDEVNETFLHRIDEQADRLNQLVLDLLSLARLESGQEFFHHAPVWLPPLFDRIAAAHAERAVAAGLDYAPLIDPDAADAVVTADEEAIRQILDNLIDNAIKYTLQGGRVRVALRRPAPDAIVLEVADTGIGIPRADIPRVFERFYRVDKARSRELGGTGLGLAIVKHLAQSLGGSVAVESRLGAGSTFRVRLPANPDAPPRAGEGS
jgi:two-component system phosphate regulon sensor histidine kinase PhoR